MHDITEIMFDVVNKNCSIQTGPIRQQGFLILYIFGDVFLRTFCVLLDFIGFGAATYGRLDSSRMEKDKEVKGHNHTLHMS